MLLVLICICVLSSNGQNKTFINKTKEFVTNTVIEKIPDSLLIKMKDTGLIKIGYDSILPNKLFDYVYSEDLSFDNGRLKLGDEIKKLPYNLKRINYSNNSKDDDYLILQTHYYFTKKSYVIEGVKNEDLPNEKKIVLGIIIKDTINCSLKNIRVGDSINKICDNYYISCLRLKKDMLNSKNDQSPKFGKERYIDIRVYENKQRKSENFLRYVWDVDTKKIVRIEVTFNDYF